MAMMITGVGIVHTPRVCATAMARSTHAFYGYFRALEQERLNPLERVVFSYVLTRANRPQCKTPMHG